MRGTREEEEEDGGKESGSAGAGGAAGQGYKEAEPLQHDPGLCLVHLHRSVRLLDD